MNDNNNVQGQYSTLSQNESLLHYPSLYRPSRSGGFRTRAGQHLNGVVQLLLTSEGGGMLSEGVCWITEARCNGGCMISGGEVSSGSSVMADPCSRKGVCPVLENAGSELVSGALSSCCEDSDWCRVKAAAVDVPGG